MGKGFRRGLIANAALDPLKMPLTLTAQEAGATVTLNVRGTLTIPGMHYRMGTSGLWLPYTAGAVLTLANVGDSVQFWNSEETLSANLDDNANFVTPKKVAASGNIQSLLNWREDCPSYAFAWLFSGCKLIKMPILPAKTISKGTYCYTFHNNNYLTETTLICAEKGLAASSMESMLRYCSRLSVIRTLTPTLGVNNSFNWVQGVASAGTFYKTSALPENYGAHYIPEGWTVVNID